MTTIEDLAGPTRLRRVVRLAVRQSRPLDPSGQLMMHIIVAVGLIREGTHPRAGRRHSDGSETRRSDRTAQRI
jgi:hypothetical protein